MTLPGNGPARNFGAAVQLLQVTTDYSHICPVPPEGVFNRYVPTEDLNPTRTKYFTSLGNGGNGSVDYNTEIILLANWGANNLDEVDIDNLYDDDYKLYRKPGSKSNRFDEDDAQDPII